MENNNPEISTYNEAQLQIVRLNELWLKAEFYARRGLLIKWKFVLDSIYRELYSDILRMENSEKTKNTNEQLLKNISDSKKPSLVYFHLDERHKFLKEVQDSAGKGGIYRERDDENWE